MVFSHFTEVKSFLQGHTAPVGGRVGIWPHSVYFRCLRSVTSAKPTSFIFRIGPQTFCPCPVNPWSRPTPVSCHPFSFLPLSLLVAGVILSVSPVARVIPCLPTPGPNASPFLLIAIWPQVVCLLGKYTHLHFLEPTQPFLASGPFLAIPNLEGSSPQPHYFRPPFLKS